MSSILGQLAVAIGGLVFILSMALALSNGVPMLTSILRSTVAMCITSMIMAFFFRFFTSILYKFVAERLKEQTKTPAKDEKGKEKTTPHSMPV